MARTARDKARILRGIIEKKYQSYMPKSTARRLNSIGVTQVAPKEWRRTCDRYIIATRQKYINRMKLEEPARLNRIKQVIATHGGTLAEQIDGERRRSGIGNADTAGFYDPFGERIVVRTDDAGIIAHELLHAFSHNVKEKKYKGTWSNFRQFVPHQTNESLTQLLTEAVLRDYNAKHLDKAGGEQPSTLQSAYSTTPARGFIRKHGQKRALHGYFGGFFRMNKKAQPNPCMPGEYDKYVGAVRRKMAKPLSDYMRPVAPARPKPATHKPRTPGNTPIRILPNKPIRRRGPDPVILTPSARRLLGVGPRVARAGLATERTAAPPPSQLAQMARVMRPKRTSIAAPFRRPVSIGTPQRRKPGVAAQGRTGLNTGLTTGAFGLPKRTPKPPAPRYRVQGGDTLSAIARRMTGNAARWRELYKLNRGVIGQDPNRIRIDQKLRLPKTWATPGLTHAAGSTFGQSPISRYRIQKGDTLSGIAHSMTGDASRWRELYRHNRSRIGSNPNLIRTGHALHIPPAWKRPLSQPGALSRYAVGL